MSLLHQIRQDAARNGLREVCRDYCPGGEMFTHLGTKDGTRYRFVTPMTSQDLQIAAKAKHSLLIIIPEDERPMASVSVYATARVLMFYDEIAHTADKAFLGATTSFTGPWVQTQNQQYFLVK